MAAVPLLLVGFALQGALVLAVLGGLIGLANQVPSSFAIRMFMLVFVLVLVSMFDLEGVGVDGRIWSSCVS